MMRAESLRDMADGELARLARDVLRLGEAEISKSPPHLHELRLSIKRLRYTLEVFKPCMNEGDMTRIMPVLEEAQKLAGEVNDVLVLVERLGGYVARTSGGSS